VDNVKVCLATAGQQPPRPEGSADITDEVLQRPAQEHKRHLAHGPGNAVLAVQAFDREPSGAAFDHGGIDVAYEDDFVPAVR
jgi:hypothetical protein